MFLKKRLLQIVGVIFFVSGLSGIIMFVRSGISMKYFTTFSDILDVFISFLFFYIGYMLICPKK